MLWRFSIDDTHLYPGGEPGRVRVQERLATRADARP